MAVYSFLDNVSTLSGPTGAVSLGNGSGAAEEGITVVSTGDQNVMTIGADGGVQHSLRADRSGTVTVTLLRTSPANKILADMFRTQRASSLLHGRNSISVRNVVNGDAFTCEEVAFAKMPDFGFATEGGTVAWTFHAGKITPVVGSGAPQLF